MYLYVPPVLSMQHNLVEIPEAFNVRRHESLLYIEVSY